MTKKKEAVREYNFSDGKLKQICDEVQNSVTRDISSFTPRGVTSTTVTDFETITEDFDNFPTDEELLAEVSDAADAKNAAEERLKVSIRSIRTMAQNKWGEEAAKYRSFGFEGMDEMTDNDVHRLGKRVVRRATLYLTDLASEGLTTAMITALGTVNTTFDDGIDAVTDKTKDRDIATQTRILKGNACFKELMRLANIGKDIWASVDEAKYNDYVIYNTPGAEPLPGPLPPGP